MLRRSFLLSFITAFGAACATVFQLKQGCKISGYVFNANNPEHIGIPYHKVTLWRPGTEERHLVLANLRGWYEFPPVQPGIYRIEAEGQRSEVIISIEHQDFISLNLFVNEKFVRSDKESWNA